MPRLCLLFFLLSAIDLALTLHLLSRPGFYEVNPLAATVFAMAGPMGLVAFKSMGTALTMAMAYRVRRTHPWLADAIMRFGCLMLGAVDVWGVFLALIQCA